MFGASAKSVYGSSQWATIDPKGTRAWAIYSSGVDADPGAAYLWTACAYLNPGDTAWTRNDFGL